MIKLKREPMLDGGMCSRAVAHNSPWWIAKQASYHSDSIHRVSFYAMLSMKDKTDGQKRSG